MQTEDGRFTITYNGEIYNYAELKIQLCTHGHRFRSTSDTEVLLAAISEWGLAAALLKLNGMFAFALWDAAEGKLHLARDRFGVKPLYWAKMGTKFLFGSEIKAILANPEAETSLDSGGLCEYLAFQNFHTDRTLFNNVRMLPPGTHLTVEPSTASVGVPQRYHELRFEEPEEAGDPVALAQQFDFLLRQAVSRQLVSDVEVGCYLSGGIDSGAITAIASSELAHLRSFTCGFDMSSASGLELYFDERRDAERMSALWQTEHYEMVLKAGDMERVIPKLVWHLEEPRVGQCYPNFYIAGLASKFNKVVLAGTGGDEMFGGYPWRYNSALGGTVDEVADRTFLSWMRLLPQERYARFVAPIGGALKGPAPREIFDSIFELPGADVGLEGRVNAIMTYEARTFLHGLLTMEDKVAMAHGLEGRVPFLDNDLADFAMRLSVAHKCKLATSTTNGSGRTASGKLLLRQGITSWMPADVMSREKQGFSAPDASWFRGQSIDFVRSRIDHPRARIYNLLDFGAVKPLLDEHFNGVTNHRLLIWSLVYLEQAFETWKFA